MQRDIINNDVMQLLGDEQNSINYLRKANKIYEKISRGIIVEKDENHKLLSEQEELIQSINEVKGMQTQISEYLDFHSRIQEKVIIELESNFNTLMNKKKELKKKKKSELDCLMKKNNCIEDEINNSKITNNNLVNENSVISQSIVDWEKEKSKWKIKIDEQKERHKQLSDLSEYLSERFKCLSIEYDQLIQEKKGLVASKENIEIIIDRLKKEQEEKKSQLCKINNEINNELNLKKKEFDQVSDEINKIRVEKEINENNLRQLKEQINISENEINKINKDITSNKELLLKLSEELDRKKIETDKYMKELLEGRDNKLKINDLNSEINKIKFKLEKIDIRDESDKKFDKLIELEHINKLNAQLDSELIEMSNNLEEDERNVINDAWNKIKIYDNNDINISSIDQLLTYLQDSANYNVICNINEDNSDMVFKKNKEYIDNNELDEHIKKLVQVLDENNRQSISLKMKRGKLKRSKTIDTKMMESLLIKSLKLIEKLDGEFENDQSSNQFDEQKNEYNRSKKNNELESPESDRISNIGKRVVISNRRLLTPRKSKQIHAII
ncbi:hypothetical protein FG386_001358 [Cryptosporidium ryanae]|uniref:uncharacterized protein n=1 Tax=Cryptosporidium ryanae TaxID=515981 RepID=UPI00351A1219|nr:hypothetical protein FG386_001358 [Cryptosporidium ryanae]